MKLLSYFFMNKRIKIRFVATISGYYIQRKTIFGWEYIQFKNYINDQPTLIKYFSESKTELLKEVIKNHFGYNKDMVEITEYPQIKIYNL